MCSQSSTPFAVSHQKLLLLLVRFISRSRTSGFSAPETPIVFLFFSFLFPVWQVDRWPEEEDPGGAAGTLLPVPAEILCQAAPGPSSCRGCWFYHEAPSSPVLVHLFLPGPTEPLSMCTGKKKNHNVCLGFRKPGQSSRKKKQPKIHWFLVK